MHLQWLGGAAGPGLPWCGTDHYIVWLPKSPGDLDWLIEPQVAPARREEDKSPKDRGGGCHQGLHDCERVTKDNVFFTQEARKDQELWARFLMDEDMGLANTPQIRQPTQLTQVLHFSCCRLQGNVWQRAVVAWGFDYGGKIIFAYQLFWPEDFVVRSNLFFCPT